MLAKTPGKTPIVVESSIDSKYKKFYIHHGDFDYNTFPSSKRDEEVEKIKREHLYDDENDESSSILIHATWGYYRRQEMAVRKLYVKYFLEGQGSRIAFDVYRRYFRAKGLETTTPKYFFIYSDSDGVLKGVRILIPLDQLSAGTMQHKVSDKSCIRLFRKLSKVLDLPEWDGEEIYWNTINLTENGDPSQT